MFGMGGGGGGGGSWWLGNGKSSSLSMANRLRNTTESF